MNDTINIYEMFYSFQGESTLMGRKTLFIRLSECNLRCKICDTKYALKKNKTMSIDKILKTAKNTKVKYICITGGEPLLQAKVVNRLINGLLRLKKIVSVETNGSLPISLISDKSKRIVDVKMPSSGEEGSFLTSNLCKLTDSDELKFVISDKKDFDQAISFIRKHRPSCTLLFSPNLDKKRISRDLIKWIFNSEENVVFQPQLHKLIKERPVYL